MKRSRAKVADAHAVTELLDAFRKKLLKARPSLPSSRCISRSTLIELALEARESTSLPVLRKCSGSKLISLMEEAAVVQPIPLESDDFKTKAHLYSVGFGVADIAIPPAEMLQAHVPNGIACYFTAIELHGLSTQPSPQYHIATLRTPKTKLGALRPRTHASADRPLPLGVLQFCTGGIPCYLTQRDPANLIGVQRRQLNPYCVVRLTTLEQTLLDCLHRPQSAGGAAVIFEAWEQGLKRTTPKKVMQLAEKIGDEVLLRRASFMIERFAPGAHVLDEAKRLIGQIEPERDIPSLLPGIAFRHVDSVWGLRTP